MRSAPFSVPEINNDAELYCVGLASPMVLKEAYDVDQLWLPFIGFVVFPPRHFVVVDHVEKHEESKSKLEKRAKRKYATVPDRCVKLYVYEQGVDQTILPFSGSQLVSHKEFRRLSEAKFPCWERGRDGNIIEITIVPPCKGELVEWILENCSGRVNIGSNGRIVRFERKLDAAMFSLKFS